MPKSQLNRSATGRRQVLLGLIACFVAGCSNGTSTPYSTRFVDDPDPLARFRLPADAGAETWARHLHPDAARVDSKVLALSGGGEDGAFGAGALAGWSASGDRPTFDMVSGVSTGALIAPFAFLGPERDDDLRRIFTQHDARDLMRLSVAGAVLGTALYDTTGLEELMESFVPPAMIDAVAARHAEGRRLFVVTSELATSRAFIWNMGAIAQTGQYALFRAVMRASAALPGLFPPVELEYEHHQTAYRETHIDGGVQMQFLAVPDFEFTSPELHQNHGQIYILINNTLTPTPSAGSHSAIGVSQQAFTAMVRANAQASVNATQLHARKNGLGLFVASIDPDAGIIYDPTDRFSSEYMNALYQHGFQRGSDGSLWDIRTG